MDELQRATAHAEAEIIIALRALQARWECSVRVNITHGPLAQRSGDDGPNNVCGVEIRLLKHSMDGIDRSELEDDVQRTREAIIAQVEALEHKSMCEIDLDIDAADDRDLAYRPIVDASLTLRGISRD